MLSIKKVRTSILCAFMLSLMNTAALASANINITNSTDYPSTAAILIPGEKPLCSSLSEAEGGLGSAGITPGHSTNIIDRSNANLVCGNEFPCTIEVYMTKDCSGPIIATATLNSTVSAPVITDKHTAGFTVTINGTDVTINHK